MAERTKRSANTAGPSRYNAETYRVRLPGFIGDEEVGLGDVVKRAASAFGVKPCGGCQRRAATLNRWLVFSGRRSR